jgi:glutaconate CoA-transferase subunit A
MYDGTVPERWTSENVRADFARLPAGAVVAVGGLTLYRRPVALCRMLAESPARDLVLTGMTLAIESEAVLAAGRVRTVRTSYYGLEIFGFAPVFTRLAESGAIVVLDESERSFCDALGRDLVPDLVLLHMAFVDRDGRAWAYGTPAVDRDLLRAGRRAIVSFEEDGRPAQEGPAWWSLPLGEVAAVVRIPGGARPTSCLPWYGVDAHAILEHVRG